MNSNYVMMKVAKIPNGTWFKMGFVSDVPMIAQAKRDGHVVLKCTETTVRKGVSYKNLKSVKARIETGEVLDGSLKWGTWIPGHEGVFLEHTDKSGQYKQYLRVYTSPNKPKVTYVVDGKVMKKEDVMKLGYVQNSYWNKPDSPTECFTVNTANIQYIGHR